MHKILCATFACVLTFGDMGYCAIAQAAPEARCIDSESSGVTEAFSRPLDVPRMLAFIAFVRDIAPTDRAAVISRAAAADTTATRHEFAKALADRCAVYPEIGNGTTRLTSVIGELWSERNAADLEPNVRLAIAALALGNHISAASREASLAVFGTNTGELDKSLAAIPSTQSASPSCASGASEPVALSLARPKYPSLALRTHTGGSIEARVELERHGFTRSVRFDGKREIHDVVFGSLIDATIVAAGSSAFRPPFVHCEPTNGAYGFRASFNPDNPD